MSELKYYGPLKIEPHSAFAAFCEKSRIKAGFAAKEFGFYSSIGFSVPEDERDRLAQLVTTELAIYSQDVFQRSKLKRIVVCSGFKRTDETSWGGCCVALRGTIFLDSAALSASSDGFGKRAIHHELYHMIDFYDDIWMYADPTWEKLNHDDFRYYGPAKTNCTGETFPGFVSDYARSNIAEDKAETYSQMIINTSSIFQRAEGDAILNAKIQRMQALMSAFSPCFDQKFWDRCFSRSVEGQTKTTQQPAVEISP